MLQLPPLATLVQQGAIVLASSNMPATCRQPLLADALTQARLQRLFSVLEAALPSPAGTLMTAHLQQYHGATVAGAPPGCSQLLVCECGG